MLSLGLLELCWDLDQLAIELKLSQHERMKSVHVLQFVLKLSCSAPAYSVQVLSELVPRFSWRALLAHLVSCFDLFVQIAHVNYGE